LMTECDYIFVCINTDGSKANGEDLAPLDCESVIEVVKKIREHSSSVKICIRSTFDPGWLKALIRANRGDKHLAVVPEFLREGSAFEDFIHADRIVIGSEDFELIDDLTVILGRFCSKIIKMTIKEAIYTKLISNSMLGLLISAANELDMHLRDQNCDSSQVFAGVVSDHRWVNSPLCDYFSPSIGFGGYCLPKDISALGHILNESQTESLFHRVSIINSRVAKYHVERLLRQLDLAAPGRLVLLGTGFKNFSEDCRYSPAVKLIAMLESSGSFKGDIVVVDPNCDQTRFANALLDWGFTSGIAQSLHFKKEFLDSELTDDDFVVRLTRNKWSEQDWGALAQNFLDLSCE